MKARIPSLNLNLLQLCLAEHPCLQGLFPDLISRRSWASLQSARALLPSCGSTYLQSASSFAVLMLVLISLIPIPFIVLLLLVVFPHSGSFSTFRMRKLSITNCDKLLGYMEIRNHVMIRLICMSCPASTLSTQKKGGLETQGPGSRKVQLVKNCSVKTRLGQSGSVVAKVGKSGTKSVGFTVPPPWLSRRLCTYR